MPVLAEIAARHQEMTQWRHHLHAYPELAYEEVDTAAFVVDRLRSFGLEVHQGLARTGVVASVVNGDGPSIGLRADMDALPMAEANTFAHRSRKDGCMHACGHDGHTTMLLGAARYLTEHPRFRGTVHLIFQPAEEMAGGGRAMVDDGLFELFPMQSVFGMHNWPGLPVGQFAVCPGPIMAAVDTFEIHVRGHGGHAAMPHLCSDVIVTAAAIVNALQTVVSRSTDPLDAAVLSVTQVHSGTAWNVLPEEAVLRGTMRSLRQPIRDALMAGIKRVAECQAVAHGVSADVRLIPGFPATVNDPGAVQKAVAAASLVVGSENVNASTRPSMGAEDFGFMLSACPGAYIHVGNGSDVGPEGGGCSLHNPRYDFNDAILPIGASYWATLVETQLAP